MNKQNNIEIPNVPVIDEDDFFESLFKTGETWGDMWVRINGSHCDNCPFKSKCDPISEYLETHSDNLFYCEDLINIMLGKKEIKDFL
jgi:hypothetical protein